ncbi:hypothetical protein DPMN_069133 [Dreissena polymorpha]|uniref:Uncharacterized protein n=1 Tax=Dreissena polymorpha TaxID=45954 RepID=A0A9D4BU39_DREPO|nr:hypothetical protein DPMN_069133 [Dreissena polymorpha]
MLRKYEIEENNKLPEAVNKKHHLYEVYRSQITTAVFNKGLRKPRHRETNEEQEMLEKHESSFKTGIRNVACHGRYGNIHRADEDEEYSSTASDMADDSLVFYEHIGSFRHRLVHLSREKGKLQSIPVQSIGDNADVGGSTSMQHDCSDLQRAQSYSKTSSKAHTTMKSLSSVLSIHPSHNTLQAPDSTNYDSFEHSTEEIEKLRQRKYSKISNGQQFKQRSKSAIGQLSDSRSRFREFQSLFRRQCSAGFRLHSDMSQLVDYATQQKDEKRFEGKIGDNGKRIRTAGMYDDNNDGQFGGERKVVRKNLKELQGIRQRRLLNESSGNEGTVTNKDKQTIAQIGTKSGSEANKVEYLAIAFGSKDKNKQPSTNITIHLACDGINRISPPPVISNELDFDRGSFTSLEPDLELEFNDVIDVTQLEGIDEIETIDPEEFERKLKEERRRHKKRRKRRESKKAESDYETNNFGMKVTKDEHDDGSFKLTDTASMENHAHRWIKKKEKVVVTADEKLHDTGIPEGNVRDLVPNGTSKRASGNDSLLSRKADDVDCNRQMYQTTGHEQLTETPKTDDDSELEAGDKALKAKVNVSFKKVTDTRQSRGRKGKTKKITSIKRRSKSEKSDKEKSGERKMDNDTSGKGHQKKTKKLTRERKSRSTSDQRKWDSINNIDEFDMEKAKTIMKVMSETETEHSPPLDFENLPSIKVQLSKLLGSHQTTTGLPNKIDNLKENTESSNEEIEGKSKKNETENFDFTTRSLSAKAHDFMRSRLKKSISMPGLADLCKLHTQMDPVSKEELKRPINVPVYLPSFPQRSIILKKQFKSNPKRVQYRRDQRSMSLTHSDLQDMVPWQQEEDTTNRSELEPVREETLITPTPEPVMEREPTPQQNLQVKSPDTCRSVTPPKKKEIVKKEKKEKKPKTPELPPEQTEDEQPSPTPVSKATTPTPQPSEEFHSSREASFIREPSVPELPPIEIPELPEIPEKKRYESKVVKKEMKLIEVTPELPPEKKKLPPPPKIRPSYKPSPASRRSKVAEAPVTIQEVRMLSDPLDFLAKYCIIK